MSQIRKFFTSRFEYGYIMEFDFSQLEVACLAYLSQDKQLIQDIEDGADLHLISASTWLHKPQSEVTAAERKKAKQMTFQLQYGAGYKSMARKLDLPESETQAFIDAYYSRYSGVKDWQEDNGIMVERDRYVTDDRTPNGFPVGKAKLVNPTRRRLTFKEREVTDWRGGMTTKFWATEIKNYPVQSFAADIVGHILGKVFRAVKADKELNQNAKMIMTVHDSIVFDVEDKWAFVLYNTVMPIMMDTVNIMNRDFKLEGGAAINVPISASCEIGRDWMDMTKYN